MHDRHEDTRDLEVAHEDARSDGVFEDPSVDMADGISEPGEVPAFEEAAAAADLAAGVDIAEAELAAEEEEEDEEEDEAEAEAEEEEERMAAEAAVAGDEVSDEPPPKVSRKVRRRSRRTRPRSKTIAMKRLTREELRLGALMNPPVDIPRPETRAECLEEARPCPWVACKYHLYLDVNPDTGSIKINFPDLEPWEMGDTCALDVADRNGITLEEVGEIMNLTRERIRQVEVRGLLKLKMSSPSPGDLGADSDPE